MSKTKKKSNPIVTVMTINGPREVEKYLLHRVQPDLGYALKDRERDIEIFYHTDEKIVQQVLTDILEHRLDVSIDENLKLFPYLYSPNNIENRARIVMFDEKHSQRHFIYNNRAEFYAIMLFVLIERFESGDWYFEGDMPEEMEMSLDEIEKIKDQATKDFALEKYHNYQRELKDYQKENQQYLNIEKAVQEKNGQIAYNIMASRRNYEYENFETIEPESLE